MGSVRRCGVKFERRLTAECLGGLEADDQLEFRREIYLTIATVSKSDFRFTLKAVSERTLRHVRCVPRTAIRAGSASRIASAQFVSPATELS
jgi:hypothetical protein